MKVSLTIVKQLTGLELPPIDELVKRINEQLGGVEAVIDVNAQYKDARIVRVVVCEKHPNADRLNVTKIDDGGAIPDIPRDENGLVQVVCGAPNVHADMWAIWLPPRSTVPASFGTDEPFVLGERKLRGIMSQGMLAAADELAIGADHSGIIEITDHDVQNAATLAAGVSFAETFGLNDTVIDIENKMFTHRPDCFGQIGVAREIAAIFGDEAALLEPFSAENDTRFKNPDWYWVHPQFSRMAELPLIVQNNAHEKVPRLMAVAMHNVAVRPSPLWLQCALVVMGVKPINNVVDATNYIMLMTAQPTHAYDYDKLRGHTVTARMAEDGEKIQLLNGKTYELTADDIVMADAEQAVGLAGIMGGMDSDVDETTKNIVLEVATFDMYAVRKMSMRHGVFTDAVTRFNKGQSPLQNDRIIARLMAIVHELSSAEQASDVYDEPANAWARQESLHGEMKVAAQFINERLGSTLTTEYIANILRQVNFASYSPDDDPDSLLITAPFWRTDIELPEDIVEEVGRLYGFDKLPRMLPRRSIAPAPRHQRRLVKQHIREMLSRAGANEVLSYSFVHERVLKNAEQTVGNAYKISNALSPNLQYYRLNVLPSLLDKVHANIKAGYDAFALFEIGKGHDKKLTRDTDGLPNEWTFVDAVYTSKKPQPGAAYYHARRQALELLNTIGISATTATMTTTEDSAASVFEPPRSAAIVANDGTQLGFVGELKATVRHGFKLPEYTSAFSIDFDALFGQMTNTAGYTPLSRYPSTSRDVTLQTDIAVPYQEILQSIRRAVTPYKETLSVEITPKSIYKAKNDATHSATTFHLTLTSYDHTLTDADVEPVLKAIAVGAHGDHGATII